MIEKIVAIAIISCGVIYLLLLSTAVFLDTKDRKTQYHYLICNKGLLHHPDRPVKVCLYCGYETRI
jgi:hypothetical protein